LLQVVEHLFKHLQTAEDRNHICYCQKHRGNDLAQQKTSYSLSTYKKEQSKRVTWYPALA